MPKDPTLVGNRYHKQFCKCGHTKQDHKGKGLIRDNKTKRTDCESPYCNCNAYDFWKWGKE